MKREKSPTSDLGLSSEADNSTLHQRVRLRRVQSRGTTTTMGAKMPMEDLRTDIRLPPVAVFRTEHQASDVPHEGRALALPLRFAGAEREPWQPYFTVEFSRKIR